MIDVYHYRSGRHVQCFTLTFVCTAPIIFPRFYQCPCSVQDLSIWLSCVGFVYLIVRHYWSKVEKIVNVSGMLSFCYMFLFNMFSSEIYCLLTAVGLSILGEKLKTLSINIILCFLLVPHLCLCFLFISLVLVSWSYFVLYSQQLIVFVPLYYLRLFFVVREFRDS